MAAKYVAFGDTASMVAEYGACEMPKEWLKKWGYRYCVLIIGDENYDTEFCETFAEAKANARWTADQFGVKTTRV